MNIVANQLELSNGARRDKSECLVDAEQFIAPPLIQKRGALYIITETETMAAGRPRPGDVDLCKEAQDIIVQEFYNSNLTATITSAMRSALEKANQAIFNRNSAVLPPDRRGLGLTMAVVRGNEVFTAQMPPTQAFISHQGELKLLPDSNKGPLPGATAPRPSQVLTGTDAQATMPVPRHQSLPALGRYTSIEPGLSRHVFEEGDLLVLCSSQFAQALQTQDLEWIMLKQDSRHALLNLSEFARNRGINDAYSMCISVREDFAARPQPPRHDETGWRNNVEGVAGAVSLFASRLTPKSGRPADDTDRPAPAQGQAETRLGHPAPALDREPPPFVRQATPGRTPLPEHNLKTPPPEMDPLAPLTSANAANDTWMAREDDELNRPAYLRGRTVPSAHPVPEPPAPAAPEQIFKNQQAGSFRVPLQTQSTEPHSRRNFDYTDASEEPVYTANARSHPAASSPTPPDPELTPQSPTDQPGPSGAWGQAFAQGGKNKDKDKARKNNARPQPTTPPRIDTTRPSNPYFDLVGQDGYNPPEPRATLRERLSQNRNLLVLAGGVVAGLVILGLVVSFIAGRLVNTDGKAMEFVRAAEQKRAAAQQLAAPEPGRARGLITQAQTDLEAARKEKPDLPDIKVMQNNLKLTLDNINRVIIPADLRQALDLTSQGSGVRLARAVITPAGDSIYLMDTGRNAIYIAEVQGEVKPILKNGDRSGGAVFGKPVLLVARPDGVMVLDDGNVLWLYNKPGNNWTTQALGGTSGWGSKGIRQSASYQGNLYLTGPVSGQILKYNAGQYGANPEEWVNPGIAANSNLDSAAGLSIDGTIYALTTDGKILQMARPNGRDKGEIVKQFELKNDRLGPPLVGPLALNAGSLGFQYMFVLDGEKRLLQFSKEDGAFIQQFQAAPGRKEFDNLQDILVDEVNKKIYLIGLQKVHVFNLPPAAAPAPTGSPRPLSDSTPGAGTNVTVITSIPTVRP